MTSFVVNMVLCKDSQNRKSFKLRTEVVRANNSAEALGITMSNRGELDYSIVLYNSIELEVATMENDPESTEIK